MFVEDSILQFPVKSCQCSTVLLIIRVRFVGHSESHRKLVDLMLLGCRSCHLGAVRHASTSQYYDAIVVGGGLVGNAIACAMGQNSKLSSKRVLLLEGGNTSSLPKSPPEHYSNRVSAVGPASIHLFRKLGIWDRLHDYRVKKVNRLRVIDNCSRAELEFDPPLKDQEIAYIIENNAIIGALYDRIKETCPTVEVRTGATVKHCNLPPSLNDVATIELDSGEKIETSLVIGADGARSRIRQSMNVDYTSFNYHQSGVVATLVVETPGENDVAWQRFCRAGPIAYLPLSRTLSSLVWTTSTEDAQRLLSLTKDEFVDELNHSMFTEEDQNDCVNKSLFMLSKLPLISKEIGPTPQPPHVVSLQGDSRASFPLGFGHSHTYVHTRAVLIGDAAHRTHPLAGQGVNLGWHDVMILDRVLGRAASDGADIGSVTYLREYDSEAQRHNLPVMVSCDWLNRLYRTNAAPVVMLRSLGLAAFNRLTPIKDFLVSQLSTPH
ncbi:ubiquinone biosynthesis monooxygenase COQ6 [Ancylostoma ceylanicum]|uniref:Ubiquinone biosynthesis monooxygenase COQ6, mitochondrial n=1 Tax=Ancylostoma ceylanicum TaxID=53326 RepID=A0A0D6LBE5_9BILA|nr:ubiquinone biosynthesis monooxygenase COQ6 [Ancylostoma ceylanicum]